MIQYKIKDTFNPVALENLRLEGKIARLTDIFFEERILSDFAKNTVYKECEDAFKNQVDDESPVCYWQGEFWGKWIISAARVCRYKNDENLKEFLKNAAHNLLTVQREDGYIGTYKDSKNVFAADPTVTRSIIGWNCDWNWNIWCRKYTLWGLLEVYSLTEDKKYLDFCLDIAARWETPKIAGLIYNSLNKTRLCEWYENFIKWSKTYESLSCFDGIIELYRVTGEEKYLTAAENFYELLERDEKNILFSVGYNDRYYNAAQSALFSGGGSITIALYHPYEAEITVGETKARVKVSGDYLNTSNADINISFEGKALPIRLRIPVWTRVGKISFGRQYRNRRKRTL